MPYMLTRDDDGTFAVQSGANAPIGVKTYATELLAHEAALSYLKRERDQINVAIIETGRRIRACKR